MRFLIVQVVFFLSLLVCQGCNLAPRYSRPEVTMPTSFRTTSEVGEDEDNIAWWKGLGDEVLDGLIGKALANNRDLQVAVWRVKEYLAEYEEVRASLFPQIAGNSIAVKEKLPINENFLPPGMSPITPDYSLVGTLSYELDFWGQLRNQTSAAYSEYLAQVEDRKTVVLTLVASVVQSYITLRQLDLQLEFAKNTLESRKESLEIAKDRFEGGLTSKIEVDQALSVYEEAVAAVENYERQIPQQENLICVLLGESSHEIPRGASLQDMDLPYNVPAGLPSDLLTRRPDILKAENALQAANANVGVARAAFFPQVTFAALYGVNSLQLKKLLHKSSTTWAIGGSLLQQIFTGGALVAQLRVAEAQKKELIFSYQQKILEAFREVNDALIGLEKSKEIFKAYQTQVAALKDYLSLAWYRYYEGQTEYLTVLDAERHVFDAEIHLASAQADQFLFLVNLYKSLGGGWVVEADREVHPE